MSDQLKPCPFCGSPAKEEYDHDNREHWVVCGNNSCDIAPTSSSPDLGRARSYWNTRKKPHHPDAVVAFTIKCDKARTLWWAHGEELVPGLNLCGDTLAKVLADLIPAWAHLHKYAPQQVPAPPPEAVKAEREVAALRDKTIEECAQVLDRIVASMESHTNPDGIVTGRDFHHPEIDYIEHAAEAIRALKGSP